MLMSYYVLCKRKRWWRPPLSESIVDCSLHWCHFLLYLSNVIKECKYRLYTLEFDSWIDMMTEETRRPFEFMGKRRKQNWKTYETIEWKLNFSFCRRMVTKDFCPDFLPFLRQTISSWIIYISSFVIKGFSMSHENKYRRRMNKHNPHCSLLREKKRKENFWIYLLHTPNA